MKETTIAKLQALMEKIAFDTNAAYREPDYVMGAMVAFLAAEIDAVRRDMEESFREMRVNQ